MSDSLRIYTQANFNSSSPELERLFSHLIFPSEFYRLGDQLIWIAYVTTFAFSSCALIDPLLEDKYVLYLRNDGNQMTISQGGKDLPQVLSRKLARYHHRMATFLPLLSFTIVTVAQQFYLYFFISYWTGSVHDFLILFLLIPYFFYGIFTNLFNITFYYCTVRCLRLKQNYLREEICKLTGKLSRKHFQKSRTRMAPQILALNRNFQRLQGQVLALYEEIGGQNRFWSKYLTVYFLHYIPEICIFLYGALFLQTDIFSLQRIFFFFFAAEFIAIVTLICYQSSMVVYRNIQLHKQCLVFVQLIQMALPFPTRDLLKFNNLAASIQSIPSIAFTLIDHQRVNSQMFQMVVMYISITYMHMIEMLRK